MDCETLDKSITLNRYPWGLFNNMLKSVRNFVVSNAVDLVILKLSCVNYQFSHSVVSDSLWPHESQHARPPCPSPTPWVHPNSCASSQWCHPAISSSVIPFSSCPQSLPASGPFPMSQLRMRWLKYWSFSFSIIPSKEHPGLISFRKSFLYTFLN